MKISAAIEKRDGLQGELNRINSQIAIYQRNLKETQERCNSLKSQIAASQAELNTLEQRIAQIALEITNANQLVQQKMAVVQRLEEQLA